MYIYVCCIRGADDSGAGEGTGSASLGNSYAPSSSGKISLSIYITILSVSLKKTGRGCSREAGNLSWHGPLHQEVDMT